MFRTGLTVSALLAPAIAFAAVAGPPAGSAAALMAAEHHAMAPLSKLMAGTWRGKATFTSPAGTPYTMTQTERVHSMLDGTVLVMEGQGRAANGRNEFGALGIVAFDPRKHAYDMRAYAQGRAGDFAFEPSKDGFVWSIPAGPTTIRYTATVRDGTWQEVGDRMTAGGKAARFFEMTLHREGGAD